jgi:hypothetical protein
VSHHGPWKSGQEEGTKILQRNPHERGKKDGLVGTETFSQETMHKGKDAIKEAQVPYQEEEDKSTEDEWNIAVGVDCDDDPVKATEERREPGEETTAEASQGALSIEGEKERDESKPGEELEVNVRKGQDEENRRQETQNNVL